MKTPWPRRTPTLGSDSRVLCDTRTCPRLLSGLSLNCYGRKTSAAVTAAVVVVVVASPLLLVAADLRGKNSPRQAIKQTSNDLLPPLTPHSTNQARANPRAELQFRGAKTMHCECGEHNAARPNSTQCQRKRPGRGPGKRWQAT